MTTTTFRIIAYPHGVRTVVGIHHARFAEDVVAHASAQAKVRGEFVDVERDRVGTSIGQVIAVVGADGPVAA